MDFENVILATEKTENGTVTAEEQQSTSDNPVLEPFEPPSTISLTSSAKSLFRRYLPNQNNNSIPAPTSAVGRTPTANGTRTEGRVETVRSIHVVEESATKVDEISRAKSLFPLQATRTILPPQTNVSNNPTSSSVASSSPIRSMRFLHRPRTWSRDSNNSTESSPAVTTSMNFTSIASSLNRPLNRIRAYSSSEIERQRKVQLQRQQQHNQEDSDESSTFPLLYISFPQVSEGNISTTSKSLRRNSSRRVTFNEGRSSFKMCEDSRSPSSSLLSRKNVVASNRMQKEVQRFISRDASLKYPSHYGNDGDSGLLSFECMRMRTISPTIFVLSYMTILALVHMTSIIIVSFLDMISNGIWNVSIDIDLITVTNLLHAIVTILFVHWIKGRNSFLFISEGVPFDAQGEMNAMTVWEQLEAVPESGSIKQILYILPTVVTYAACVGCNFKSPFCQLNVLLWCICIVGKLPFMNGVRLFGINRTAGIDDEYNLPEDTTIGSTDESESRTKTKQHYRYVHNKNKVY